MKGEAKTAATFGQPGSGNTPGVSSGDGGMAGASTQEPSPSRGAGLVKGSFGPSPTREDLHQVNHLGARRLIRTASSPSLSSTKCLRE
jgi:hypothetical protein